MRNHYLQGMHVLGGAAIANIALSQSDIDALLQSSIDMIAKSSEADAVAIATDLNYLMQDYVDQFTKINRTDYVNSATELGNRAYDLVINYDETVGDPSLPGKVANLQKAVNVWFKGAGEVLRASGPYDTTQPPPSDMTQPPPSDTTQPPPSDYGSGGGYGDSGGGGGGSSGIDESQVDWGDGEGGVAEEEMLDDISPGGQDFDEDVDWGEVSPRDFGNERSIDDFDSSDFTPESSIEPDFEMQDLNDFVEEYTEEAPIDETESEEVVGSNYIIGADILGGEVTIPTVGANYTDAKTVTAVQAALRSKGYDLGKTGPNKDGVDGVFGNKTADAIKKLQASLGVEVNGRIDESVIMALKVTPGVLPPGVTLAGRAAVQAQVALDAATKASHDATPSDVQSTAREVQAVAETATPPLPPKVQDKVTQAVNAAKSAKTPQQAQAAAALVTSAAKEVHAAVAPSWWVQPLYYGAPFKRWQAVAAGGAGLFAGIGLALIARHKK